MRRDTPMDDESHRATIQRLAAIVDTCHRELSALPEKPLTFEAKRSLATAASQLRVLTALTLPEGSKAYRFRRGTGRKALTPDPAPPRRAKAGD
jgi:hypothetical protein